MEARANRKRRKTEGTAYHEAGHAYGALRLGIPFKYVTVKKDNTNHSLGHLKYESGVIPPKSRKRAENLVIVSLLGELAEGKYFNEKPKPRLHGSHRDRETVIEVVEDFCAGPLELAPYCDWLYARARTIIEFSDLPWRSITAIAEKLISNETLSELETREIYNRAAHTK